jgi:hypothetical protein
MLERKGIAHEIKDLAMRLSRHPGPIPPFLPREWLAKQ